MTASAPPEINLPKEAVSHFRASAPPEASLSSEESLAVLPLCPQEPLPSPRSITSYDSHIDSVESPLVCASPLASLAPLTQSPSGSQSLALSLPPLSENVSSSHSEVSLPSTSLTQVEISWLKDCDDIGLMLLSIPQN